MGAIHSVVGRGVERRHFSDTPSGNECAQVFEWAAQHTRRYGVSPSPQLVKSTFPQWHGESSPDPLEALCDEFLAEVKRRTFESKVMELAQLSQDPMYRLKRDTLDEIMLDAARDLASVVPSGRHVQRLGEMEMRIERYEEEHQTGVIPGIAMGVPVFDFCTGGMKPGHLVTIAGPSGRGKSTLAQWFLVNAHDQDKQGLLVSLEMTPDEVFERIDTMIMHFSQRLLGQRDLPEEQVAHWRRVAGVYANAKADIVVCDAPGATLDRIYSEINRYRPDITVVDYVQLMGRSNRAQARWESLVDTTNELKELAMATDSVIVMVSQDGRDSFEHGSSETNAGGSISVYQAANSYIGMHQDDEMRARDQIELRLLKNRRGPRAETDLLWRPDTGEFAPWEGYGAERFVKAPTAVAA